MSGLANHSRYSREKLTPLFGQEAAHAENMQLGSDLLRDACLRELAMIRRRTRG